MQSRLFSLRYNEIKSGYKMGRISKSYIKSFPKFALLSYYFVIIAHNRMIRSVLSFLTWKYFYNAFAFAFCCLLDNNIGVCFLLIKFVWSTLIKYDESFVGCLSDGSRLLYVWSAIP